MRDRVEIWVPPCYSARLRASRLGLGCWLQNKRRKRRRKKNLKRDSLFLRKVRLLAKRSSILRISVCLECSLFKMRLWRSRRIILRIQEDRTQRCPSENQRRMWKKSKKRSNRALIKHSLKVKELIVTSCFLIPPSQKKRKIFSDLSSVVLRLTALIVKVSSTHS